jgi:Polyketide cyclase / dehydrase and lipid transport.
MRRSHTFSIQIDRPVEAVYRFLADPINYPAWSAMRAEGYRRLDNGDWSGRTAFGPRHVRFTPPNGYGVLDHALFEPGGEVLMMPMRVVANEAGTELTYTFFRRTGMDDALFDSTLEWIHTDLMTLKTMLEALGDR